MNAWEGIGTTLVAAFVSLAVSFAFRWWESTQVRWVVTGEAHDEYRGGKPTGFVTATVVFHNVGDGDAYGVTTERCNGEGLESWFAFERGKVAAGESIEVVTTLPPERWEQAQVELRWESSPTARSTTTHVLRHQLSSVAWRTTGVPFPETNARLRTKLRPPEPQPKRRGLLRSRG